MRRRRVTLWELGFWYALAAGVLKPPARLLTRREWRGLEHIPPSGGVIVAANHISLVDPITLVDFVLFGAGRVARFLAKDTLFRGNGLLGRVMRGAQQIPVRRDTGDAAEALSAAVEALRRGECVILYPEGTVTRDRDLWPMRARTGVARLALLSGAPVVPVAQWGPQHIHRYGERRVHLLPRTPVQVLAGPPVDLSAYVGREPTSEVLRAVTDDVMAAITRLLEQLRGEPAPAQVHVHHPRAARAPGQTRRTA